MDNGQPATSREDVVALARAIAAKAHQGQTDKLGAAYIGHPARVAEHARRLGGDEYAVAAAWLHDVIEDCEVSATDLSAAGIPREVCDAVVLLSKRPGQSLEEYCTGVLANPLALLVKRADLADNTDPERTSLLPEHTRARLAAKYARTAQLLGVRPEQ